ncbi:hypothetical protein GQ602_007212 [Ophiocordyceps camponoti-floridani]|uniref:Uncharacterized protein n=1 Tax=Ophiocordyceps camponoti-floridani TaxID=2030778 RepID=A0A8H4VAU4_9HYPO|nr:hypothetical protein GQ602_007212 [Ophiocordyceps camponoti-floridani]
MMPLHCPRPRSSLLRTPEPASDEAATVTPPARPPRLRLKRRAVSNLAAPTQHFLASVAAADVPLPSIELFDDEMLHDARTDRNPIRGRALSPPKTPAPRDVPSLSPKRFPDWTIDTSLSSLESSPDYESSRPSTARSTQTSASVFSRFSLSSGDVSQCTSPEQAFQDRFAPLLPVDDMDKTIKGFARPVITLRKAPWTRPMSKHLWSTYMMYLQDPKVTPFRIGRSGIPPSGVCLRVAREAKRSWKGSRNQAPSEANSGSITPRPESSVPYVSWPHTCAATRAHLRELCKMYSATATRDRHYMARSPTPFGKTATRYWNRRSAPPQSPSVFSGSDMAMSLAVCTAESMQPQGPLARLSVPDEARRADAVADHSQEQAGARLGSPFVVAKSYGPSSSGALGVTTQRKSRTVSVRRSLGSPVRLRYSRGSTQKRRSKQPTAEPRRSKRPILGSDFWTDPADTATVPFTEFCSTSSNMRDKLFVPRTNVQELFEAAPCPSAERNSADKPRDSLLLPPPRLGSPFDAKSASFSFPSRRSSTASVMGFSAARRPFATVHESSDGAATGPARPSLASRLAYIDGRLQDLRRQEAPSRRSHSPL